jgi:hypothetical protein
MSDRFFFVCLYRMQGNKTGIAIVAAGLAYVIYRGFQKTTAVRTLNWNITGVDFNKQDRTLVVKLRLINPANASIKIRSIVGDVIFKGDYVATIDYRNELELKPNEERTIQLAVKPNISLVTILTNLITQKTKQALSGKLEIKGSINAESLVVPFTYENEIKLI